MTTIAAALLLAGTVLAAVAVLAYQDNAHHADRDYETMRIARTVATWCRWAIPAGIVLWCLAGNTTGPALLPWMLLAFGAALATYSTKPGKTVVNGEPVL